MEHFDFPHSVGGHGRHGEHFDDTPLSKRTGSKRTEKEQSATTHQAKARKKMTKLKLTKLSRWSKKNIAEPINSDHKKDFYIAIRVV